MRCWRRYWKFLLALAVVVGLVLLQFSGRRGENRIAPSLHETAAGHGSLLSPLPAFRLRFIPS
ncbi:hypothetical protein [Microbulbifer yueqingensis]|uniref:Uncharacterized protein n=1 Tax=Microbulbifer yueqingensis TaxID=658219 RepID=A0A1G9DNJ4_9GAMM|nr:hypothetical protein [Microbulbifer yueqingensis]SDK65380.1 hypothetical protein SAMN05216212_2884 [Microbulbifer yueqingensis]